jgi:hypothetical protein
MYNMYVCMYVCKEWAKILVALALQPPRSVVLGQTVNDNMQSGSHCISILQT